MTGLGAFTLDLAGLLGLAELQALARLSTLKLAFAPWLPRLPSSQGNSRRLQVGQSTESRSEARFTCRMRLSHSSNTVSEQLIAEGEQSRAARSTL